MGSHFPKANKLLRRQQLRLKNAAEAEDPTSKAGKGKGRGRGKKGKGKGKGRGRGNGGNSKPSPKKAAPKAKASASKGKVKTPQVEISGERTKDKEKVDTKRRKTEESEAKGAVDDGSSGNVTWARRRRPKSEFGAIKWDTLKAVFTEHIRPRLTYSSAHEDNFSPKTGHFCFTKPLDIDFGNQIYTINCFQIQTGGSTRAWVFSEPTKNLNVPNPQDRFWMYCTERWAKKEITKENVWEETREAASQYVASIKDDPSK